MDSEFCNNCGIRFPSNAKFCGKCGGERMSMDTDVPKEDDEGLRKVLPKTEKENEGEYKDAIRIWGVILMIIAIGAYVVPISDGFTLSGISDACSNPMMVGNESCVTIKWWMAGANIAGILGFISLVSARKISVWLDKN